MVQQISQDLESGSEHRKSPRYRLSIPAIVFHEGMQLLSAGIEDFCQNGMFLVTQGQELPAYIDNGSLITIQFSTGETSGASTCSLDAKIVRISNDGIGVHLLKESPRVIDVLNKLSKQLYSDANQGTDANALIDKRQTTQLASDLIAPKLTRLAEQCLDECYELISNRMSSPKSNHYANRYFEALSELKTKKLNLIDEFINAQQRALLDDGNKNTDQSHQSSQTSPELSLSLVDEGEFEDWLAIQEMSKRIERRHEDVLAQLRSQLSSMMTIDNPQHDIVIAPTVLCASFNEALCALGFDGSMRILIYPGLEEGLQLYLGQFYQQLNEELIERGYQPENTPTRVARAPRQTQQPDNSSGTEAEVLTEGDLPAEAIDQAGGIAHTQPAIHSQISNDINQTQRSIARNKVSELQSLAQVLQSMQTASAVLHPAENYNAVQHLSNTGNVDTVREIIQSIVPVKSNNDAMLALQEQIIQALVVQQGSEHVIDQQKSTALAANTQVFDALRNQVDSQSSTQSYLQQLQLPFLHHALTKQNGDQSDDVVQHIINLLDQISRLIGDSNQAWAVEAKKNIAGLVQSIVRESVTRPEILKDVEAELVGYANKAVKGRDKAESKLIETCEGRQRVRKAKRQINQILEQQLAGKTVPVIIPRLLKAGWKQILVRTELRDGLYGDQWQQNFGVIEHLHEWLTDPENNQSIPEDQIQALLDLVDQQLSEIGLDRGKQKNIMGELVALLLGTGTPRVITPSKLMTIKPLESTQDSPDTINSKCRWVDNLQVGDWFEFSVGKQRQEKLKLIWLGSDPWHSVFVNQRGVKRLEFSREQLIKHYQAKMVSKIESPDQPIALRAKHAVVEKLYTDVRHGSLEDSRVGLPNSKGLLTYLRETDFQTEATLVLVEIDDYRVISQACGMEAGDDVVKEIGQRMQQHSASNAMLARLDDQSLAMVLPDTSVDNFYRMASGWSEGLRSEPFKHENQSFPIVLSIGLIGFTQESLHVDQLVKNATVACAGAKQSGTNHIKVYSEDDRQLQQRAEQIEWAGHIDKTLAENRLVLACQPIVPIVNSGVDIQQTVRGQHYEILLRVLDAKGRIGPPGSFLAAGEQLRRMPDIDRWVIRNLMQWMQDNLELVNQLDGFSVNLSGQSVASESFLRFVTEQVFEVNFDPSKLTFEITETVAIDDFEYVQKFIQHMKKLGCKFSLDDFGSGYASYSYLRNLDVDYLKIDGLFVKDLHNDSKDLMMVKSMNDIAHSLGLKTIAEFVENSEILALLGEIGVDFAQGYHLGKPTPISDLLKNSVETSHQNKQAVI